MGQKKKKTENLIGTPKIRLRALLHLSTNMSSKWKGAFVSMEPTS